MSAPKVGDRVQAVLADEFGTELPDMVGTVVPIAEWPATMPDQWTEENTLIVRWDRATPSYSVYRPNVAARMLRVLDPEDDGTEAESLAEVQDPLDPVGALTGEPHPQKRIA